MDPTHRPVSGSRSVQYRDGAVALVALRPRGVLVAESGSVVSAGDVFKIEPIPGASVGMINGENHGLGLSLIFGNWPPDSGPGAHRHSRASAICVIEGRGVFTVNRAELTAETGDVVMFPANAWHTFHNIGDGPLRTIAADEGGQLDIEFPEPSAN
jgi:mannose-6-phosphate isomerase-like protein (cupin superfamily)